MIKIPPPSIYDPVTGTEVNPSADLISCHTGVKASGHSNVDLRRNSR